MALHNETLTTALPLIHRKWNAHWADSYLFKNSIFTSSQGHELFSRRGSPRCRLLIVQPNLPFLWSITCLITLNHCVIIIFVNLFSQQYLDLNSSNFTKTTKLKNELLRFWQSEVRVTVASHPSCLCEHDISGMLWGNCGAHVHLAPRMNWYHHIKTLIQSTYYTSLDRCGCKRWCTDANNYKVVILGSYYVSSSLFLSFLKLFTLLVTLSSPLLTMSAGSRHNWIMCVW